MKARAADLRTDINITPLIDIVLVLLIVFIVMVPAMGYAQRAQSPLNGAGPVVPAPELPRMVLRADGGYQLGDDVLAPGVLVDRLVPLLKAHAPKDRKVRLQVPAEASFQEVSHAMDLVHQAAGRVGKAGDVRTVLVEQK